MFESKLYINQNIKFKYQQNREANESKCLIFRWLKGAFNNIFIFPFSVKIASLKYSAVEQELFPLATQASEYMDRLFPAGKLAEVCGL